MSAQDARTRANELGLDEDSQLTTAQVIELSGLSDRQVRRLYKGTLPSSEIPGRKGPERRVRLADLLTWIETRPAATTAQKSPHVTPRTIDTTATADELRTMRELLEQRDAKIDTMARMIEALAADVHDTRGQLYQLKTDILKALPARIEDAEIEPAKPRSKFLQWWRKH
jgi:hypothetical protein